MSIYKNNLIKIQSEDSKEFDKETREIWTRTQKGEFDHPARKAAYRCTCSRNGMEMTFHKDYCELSLMGGKY